MGFEGVTTMNDAEALARPRACGFPAEALRALEAGAFYVHDLVGCEVGTSAGAVVGQVEQR